MSELNHRYPAETPFDVEAFPSIGLEQLLADVDQTYTAFWQTLSALARTAVENGQMTKAKALWLLADLCAMMLQPTNRNEPFKPYAICDNRRSMALVDLVASEYEFIQVIVGDLSDGLLKARLSDVLWVTPGQRSLKHALAAIDGYATLTLHEATWHADGQDCMHRALTLARQIGKGGGDRLEQLTHCLFETLTMALEQNNDFATVLADTVMTFRLTHASSADLPSRLAEAGRSFERGGQLLKARRSYEAAQQCYLLAGDATSAAGISAALAQTWVKEATLIEQRSGLGSLAAICGLEKALQVCRSIPLKFRGGLRVDEEIPRIRQRIAESGARAVEQMHTFSTRTDITDIVARTRKMITGKSIANAVYNLTALFPFSSVASVREAAMHTLQTGIVSALSGATFLDETGRVIAKQPPLSLSAESTEANEEVIGIQMIRSHSFTMTLTVQGGVMPALGLIALEHCIKEQDMVELAKASTMVPPNRALMVGRGLYWGFAGDFGMAAHFLIPQIENIVRYQMKAGGLNTSTTSAEGIVTENGLSTLLDVEGVDDVLGADVAFEIKALFCSPFGPNLRNAFAHGLIDDDAFYTIPVVYAWWFILKLISTPYWNGMIKAQESR